MEKETELYLVNRIKELEKVVAVLKDEVERHLYREKTTQKIMPRLSNKAVAFDKVQNILNIAVGGYPSKKQYFIYSPKHSKGSKSMFEKIKIDEETYELIRRAIVNDDWD